MISNDEIDFEKALSLSCEKFEYGDLINLLKTNNLPEKQFAALNLEELKSKEDASLLCSNLTGQNGKVREAVSFKLAEFFKNPKTAELLSSDENFSVMLDGLMDINGNVCRNIIEIENENFDKFLAKNIIERIEIILDDISKLSIDDKQYVISKRNFQLYWALECVYKIHHLIKFENIKNILIKTAEFEDYTIREKTAKIISQYNGDDVAEIKNLLIKNSNYYVNRYL